MLRQKLSADPRHELEQRVKTTHDVKLYRRAKVILYQDAKLGTAQWKRVQVWLKQGPKALGDCFAKWTTRSGM